MTTPATTSTPRAGFNCAVYSNLVEQCRQILEAESWARIYGHVGDDAKARARAVMDDSAKAVEAIAADISTHRLYSPRMGRRMLAGLIAERVAKELEAKAK